MPYNIVIHSYIHSFIAIQYVFLPNDGDHEDLLLLLLHVAGVSLAFQHCHYYYWWWFPAEYYWNCYCQILFLVMTVMCLSIVADADAAVAVVVPDDDAMLNEAYHHQHLPYAKNYPRVDIVVTVKIGARRVRSIELVAADVAAAVEIVFAMSS